MKLRIALLALFCVAFASFGARLPVAMNTTNGQAKGTTTIGGRFNATNSLETNFISGKLVIGETNPAFSTYSKLAITSTLTNPTLNVEQSLSRVRVVQTASDASNLFSGYTAIAQVAAGNTSDWTNSGYPQLMGFQAIIQPEAGSAGTIRRVAGFGSTLSGLSGAADLDETIMYWGDAANNDMNYLVGGKFTGLDKGVNNLGLYLGILQNTYPPSGNWGFYNDLNYPSYFRGDIHGIGGTNKFTGKVAIGPSIGLTGSTNWLDVSSGVLTTNTDALSVTATLASSASSENGVDINIVSAGSGANQNRALNVNLSGGYTGSGRTYGELLSNTALGTGLNGWLGTDANFGLNAQSGGNGSGNKVAVIGSASGSSTLNLGVFGRANSSAGSATLNVGVAGFGVNATTNVGGFFGLISADPAFITSAALMADNGAVAAPSFVARDNGTEVFRVDDGGAVQAVSLLATNFLMLPTNYVAASFVPVAGMVKICSSNGAIFSVTELSTNLIAGP